MKPVTNLSSKLAAMAALTATGGLLAGAKVHLYQNNYVPTPSMDLTSFITADYDGYVPIAVGTWDAPYVAVDGVVHIGASSLFFAMTGAVTPNTIYGAYITDTAGTGLLFAVLFDAPIPMVSATSALFYQPDLPYGA
jgi:hypothetical protein